MDSFRKKVILTFFLIFSVSTVGCAHRNIESPEATSSSNVLSDMIENVEISNYEEILSTVKEISIDETYENFSLKKQSVNGYIYFGRSTCPYCRAFILENKQKIQEWDSFYYVDTDKKSTEGTEMLEEMGVSEVPYIIKVENGATVHVEIEEFEGMVENDKQS